MAPRLAYFILPGLAVGATGVLRHTSESAGHSNAYAVGPELTYYFGREQRRLYPFVGASALIQWSHSSSTAGGDSTLVSFPDFRGQAYRGSAGIAAMVARNVAVTGEAYYADNHYRQTFGGSAFRTSSSAYGVDFGVSVFLY